MCTVAKRHRTKAPIKEKADQDTTKGMDTMEGMDTLLFSLGLPRVRQQEKASTAALVRQRLKKLVRENTSLKIEVANRTEEVARGAAEVARVTGQLTILRRRFDLMADTQDWAACARMANSLETLPPTVARRAMEVCKGSRVASHV